jgi:hypothetical protein
MLSFTSNEILALAIAASFAAGLNVYATVATLGLLSHVHAFQLPPALHLLGSWPVIVICAVLFGLEFFADKIPVFDLIWNALNTFVKVPVATFLSYGAAQHLSPGLQVAVAALFGARFQAAISPGPSHAASIFRKFDLIAGRMRYFSVDFNSPLAVPGDLPFTWSALFQETQSSSTCLPKWPAIWVMAPVCSNRCWKTLKISTRVCSSSRILSTVATT